MKQGWLPERGKRIESLNRFLRKPWLEKTLCTRFACLQVFGVIPLRLPFGGWWLIYDDSIGIRILDDRFEVAERRFVERFLRPGMTVLDIGAHHGLYTLLAARKVGPSGRVMAFEPSGRERRKLLLNVHLNRYDNVKVENCALGSTDSEADFFLVDGMNTGCNSLRPPNVAEQTKVVRVRVKTLDSRLHKRKIDRVDFIKMDAEGAEWEVLKGAVGLLDRLPRPTILCEVQEIRAQPWGYKAKEVIDFLRHRKFCWFRLLANGGLEALDAEQASFDGNFVAVPEERLKEVHDKTPECQPDALLVGSSLGVAKLIDPILTQSEESPMLTLFTHVKPFKGHVGLIQRNAISQWTRLRPRPEILLFGDGEGTVEIAQELGLRHAPEVKRSEYGTALLSDLFEKAHTLASHNILCYVNADIMLLGDFMKAVQQVVSWRHRFLMVGRRTNVDLDEPTIYESPDQEGRLQELVLRQNRLAPPSWIDYFVFPRGLFSTIPAFAIGRPWWDNWLLWKARRSNAALVDASEAVLAVHQNHDYSHDPQGWQGVRQGEDAYRNRQLAEDHFCTIEDATHKLTAGGIRYNFGHLLLPTKRVVRPWWWAFLKVTGPIRYRLGLRQDRIASVFRRFRNA